MEFHFVPGPNQTTLAKNDLSSILVKNSVQTLSVDYKTWLLSQPTPAAPPAQTQPDLPVSQAEEKLQHLKSWHQRGMITDDEYRQKRQEILKRF